MKKTKKAKKYANKIVKITKRYYKSPSPDAVYTLMDMAIDLARIMGITSQSVMELFGNRFSAHYPEVKVISSPLPAPNGTPN